ncbi:threonine/homoserine efflux transporter RhtA [Chromatocurvus halotolerans]|uniref:Threonine/homoserine efflux transporter RhtA n=1 Tax=Chromatocurvus halotolerans TaxID=1132028 RepID=A0A4R2L2K3_9GAMM|nr:threonine/homoserine efflux transporter RhtA [Chromatocurvus halotolerans]
MTLWSTAATAFKLALAHLHVLQLLAISVTVSLACLLGVVARQGRLQWLVEYLRQAPLYFLCMGLLSPLVYYLILLHAYTLLPAQQAQTINYTWAITLALLAVPVLGHRLTPRDWAAVALGYAGVVIIATEGQLLALRFSSLEGVLYALASTLVWAVFWLAGTRSRRDPVVSLALYFLVALVPVWVACVTLAGLPRSLSGLAPAVYVGMFEMGFTYVLWSTALRLSSSVSRVGNLIFLSPMLSLVFIASILKEPIHPATLVGLAFILPGIMLQQGSAAAGEDLHNA